MFSLRTIAVAGIVWLLISPDLKSTSTREEKPIVAIAIDNSSSMQNFALKTSLIPKIASKIEYLKKLNFDIKLYDLTQQREVIDLDSIKFDQPKSNLSQILNNIENENIEQNLSSIILISDGIINDGQSLDYQNFNSNIFSLGVGDTTIKKDLSIADIYYNKTVNKNVKFPIKITVAKQGFKNVITKLLFKNGSKILQQLDIVFAENEKQKDIILYAESNNEDFISYSFELTPIQEEITKTNNYRTIYIETIQSKKNILIYAQSPHPDIKIIEQTLLQNKEYEVFTYIQGIGNYPTQKPDIVILHQISSESSDFISKVNEFKKARLPIWYILGNQSNIQLCNSLIPNFKIISNGQIDKVLPVLAADFDKFLIPQNITSRMTDFAPVQVPFGAYNLAGWSVVLYQKVGNLTTDKPLWAVNTTNNESYQALTLADGLWQWSLLEKVANQEATLVNNLILKTAQLLLSSKEKRKFNFKPTKQNFDVSENIAFESESRNDIDEWITGNQISLTISNTSGKKYSYLCTNTNNAVVFETSGFEEGVYKFSAKTIINKKEEVANGTFVVSKIDIESINQTANFQVLRDLASKNKGNFDLINNFDAFIESNFKAKAVSKLFSEDSFTAPINHTWMVVLLLILLFLEWGLRKYFGSL